MAKLVGARVRNSANISCTSGVDTHLTFDTEDYDYDTIHDLSTNTNRLTCKTAGIYVIMGSVWWPNNATGSRTLSIWFGGATVIASVRYGHASVGDYEGQSVTCTYALAVNEYVELIARQSSGGALNAAYLAAYSPVFAMHKVG